MDLHCQPRPPEADGFYTTAHFQVHEDGLLSVQYEDLIPWPTSKRPQIHDLARYDANVLQAVTERRPDFNGSSDVILGNGTGVITQTPQHFLYLADVTEKYGNKLLNPDLFHTRRFNSKFGPLEQASNGILSVYRDLGGATRLCGDTFNGNRQYTDSYVAAVSELCEALFFDPCNPRRILVPRLYGDYHSLQPFYNALVVEAWRQIVPSEKWYELQFELDETFIFDTIDPGTQGYRGMDTARYTDGSLFQGLITVEWPNAALDEVVPTRLHTSREVAVRDSEFMGDTHLNRQPCMYLDMQGVWIQDPQGKKVEPAPYKTLLFYLDSERGGMHKKVGGSEVIRGGPQTNTKMQRLLDFAGFDTNYHRG